MKKYFVLPIAVLAASFVVSCQKETPSNELTETIAKKVTIHAGIPAEGLTKVSLTQDENNKKVVKLAWASGDKITINGNDFTIKSETISADGHYAEFEGDAPTPVEGKYNISYSNLPDSFAEQTQSADENTDHLRYSITLTGADAYEGVVLGSVWAAEHHATVEQSSVLRLRALLPATVADDVEKVIFKASQNVFAGGNTLTVNLTTPGTDGDDKTLDVYATLPAGDVELTEDMDLLVQFQVSGNAYDKYTAYRQVKATPKPFFESGATQYIGINCSNIASYANASATGIGTSANPYLIGDQYQMQKIHDELAAGETKYFKLVDDIDLQGVSWTPVVTGKPYNRCINFDGNNKVISNLNTKNDVGYPSLFGIFNGIAKDLTIKDATINHTTSGTDIAGVFASYIGAGTIEFSPDVRGIVIQNCTVGAESSRITSYVGGLAGQVENSDVTIKDVQVIDTDIFGPSSSGAAGGVIGHVNSSVNIEKVSFSGSVKGYWYVGGLIGVIEKIPTGKTANLTKSYSTGSVEGLYRYVGGLVGANKTGNTSAPFNIKNCYSTGSVTAGGYAAGILGSHQSSSATNLENCYSTSPVTASWSCGGIVAQATTSGLSVIRCMPFNTSITATCSDADQHYTCGAVIAYAKSVNVVVNYCYRINNLASNFQDCPGNSANVIEQHSFITTAGAIPQRKSLTYGYYHHGRNTNYSLCELIHSGAIGEDWSSEIWDWSGSIPTLK